MKVVRILSVRPTERVRHSNGKTVTLFVWLISHQPAVFFSQNKPASNTFLSEQTSTSHQPPAKRTGCVFEPGHLISVAIRTALVSGNSIFNFYDFRQKIYCLYLYSIREFVPRKKNYLYLYSQYPSASDPFSSLLGAHTRSTNVTKERTEMQLINKLTYWSITAVFLGAGHALKTKGHYTQGTRKEKGRPPCRGLALQCRGLRLPLP
jgi:hypothetical protein